MRIAAFSDVHANLPALEAVLEDIEKLGRDVQVVVAGDFLNCGPFPRETLALIRALPHATIISGNHEGYVVTSATRKEPLRPPYRALLAPSVWSASQLTTEEINWLKNLPERATLAGPEGTQIKIVHGSPRQQTEGIRASLTETDLEDIFDGEISERCLWISGHTHRPYFKKWCGMTITNNGSVGAPLDGDNRACYLLAEWDEKQGDWRVEHRRLRYDVDYALSAILANATYDQGGPFMKLMAAGLKSGTNIGITAFVNSYSALDAFPQPPQDFEHLDRAVEAHLAQLT
jgi:predicted phosphodiesterase